MKTLILILALSSTVQGQTATTQLGDVLMSIDNDKVSIFINRYHKASLALWKSDSIPISISLSQFALESNWATYELALERNNLAGIMSYEGGKKHLKQFNSLEDFYKAYARIFQKSCYKNKKLVSIEDWTTALTWEHCKYARSPEYKRKLNSIIYRWGLDLLDD